MLTDFGIHYRLESCETDPDFCFQIANVAALPGIVGKSVGLPDIHSGYGFAIGNMAAFDCGDPKAVVSPGPATGSIIFSLILVKTIIHEGRSIYLIPNVKSREG